VTTPLGGTGVGSPSDPIASGLARPALIYGTSNLLQRAIPFLLLPITTRYLTPGDFGVIAIFLVIAALSTPFAGMNAPYAIGRKAFDQENVHLPTYVANCFGVLLCGAALTALLVWPLGSTIAEMTGLPTQWTLAAVIMAAGQTFILVLLTLWQTQQMAARYALLQVSRSACSGGLTILLVVGLGLELRASSS